MNPVGDGDNQFAALFEAMPARRVGKLEDIAGAVIYLCSQAGVRTCPSDPLHLADSVVGIRGRPAPLCRWRSSTFRERAMMTEY